MQEILELLFTDHQRLAKADTLSKKTLDALSYIKELDINLFYLINHKLTNPLGDWLMPLLSYPGIDAAIWLLSSLVIDDPKHYPQRIPPAVLAVLSLLTATLLTEGLLKPIIKRDRPFKVLPDVNLLIPAPPSTSTSFPSGHALSSFACATALSRFYPQWSAIYYTLAGSISYSRVYVGVHYPSDILAGSILGHYWGLIISRWAQTTIS